VDQLPAAILPQGGGYLTAGRPWPRKTRGLQENVVTALSEFSLPIVEQVVRVLEADYTGAQREGGRSSALLRTCWCAATKRKRTARQTSCAGDASAPRVTAIRAPASIGTPARRSGGGMEFATVARAGKTRCTRYQYRATARPTSGQIAQPRRWWKAAGDRQVFRAALCRIDECRRSETRADASQSQGGVFLHLKPKMRAISRRAASRTIRG